MSSLRLEALLEALGGGEAITAAGGAGDVLKTAAGWMQRRSNQVLT
jgi:hypothetical protein